MLERVAALEPVARDASAWLELAVLYGRAEELAPADHRFAANRGNALWLADRPQDALRAYWRAARLAPAHPVVLRGLGNVQLDLNAFELAEAAYARSLALDPAPLTAWNQSQLLIGLERYAEGYALAEQRWALQAGEAWRDPASGWASTQEQLREPLLVWSEQGLGDTLQHLRWLGPLQRLRGSSAAPLLLEVEGCLVPLLRQALVPQIGPVEIRAKPEEGPEPWEGRHVSLLSLPWLLEGAPMPPGASWLESSAWPAPRPWPPQKPRIGLVWAAGRKLAEPFTAREYHRRSLDGGALGHLITGLHGLGVEIVLLQFGEDREQANPWLPLVAGALPADADFAATAAVLAELDLVISVDTSMAHLVGAMRRRGWVLLPHAAAPRWLRQRSETPWYPSLRLFRQPNTGDWDGVVNQVLTQLAQELDQARSR